MLHDKKNSQFNNNYFATILYAQDRIYDLLVSHHLYDKNYEHKSKLNSVIQEFQFQKSYLFKTFFLLLLIQYV